MPRTESSHKLIEPGGIEQQFKDVARTLAKAERRIKALQDKVADQQRQIRAFQAQAKAVQSDTVEREELKTEIADLRSESRDLIRTNREQVERLEALRTENTRLRAQAKIRKPDAVNSGADLASFLSSPRSRA